MVQSLEARFADFEQLLNTASPSPDHDTGGTAVIELEAPEERAFELAAAGVDRKEIADRLKMRTGDIELLFKLSAYRKKAV